MNIKFQCSICGQLKDRDQVTLEPYTDGRTYLYECIEECPFNVDIKPWLLKFPGSFKKLDKFIKEIPEP